jgi:hypothetical protein
MLLCDARALVLLRILIIHSMLLARTLPSTACTYGLYIATSAWMDSFYNSFFEDLRLE